MALNAGAFRFNTDSSQMEVWDGNQWTGILATSPDLETGGTRAMMLSGAYPVNTDIQIFNIATQGNAVDSGFDYGVTRYLGGAASDRTRGVYFGGYTPSAEIRFNSIPSVGSTSDFGDLSSARFGGTGVSNSTRGISLGGSGPTGGTINAGMNEIEYVTIQSLGNAADFGDLVQELASIQSCQSQTRGIISGGKEDSSNSAQNGIEYITMSTLGNASDFGDMSAVHNGNQCGGGGNAVRGIFHVGSTYSNTLEFITIATLGNSTDFGDDVMQRGGGIGFFSSPTRTVLGGGNQPSDNETNTIAFVQTMTTGNAFDFGDLINSDSAKSGYCVSNGHGGL